MKGLEKCSFLSKATRPFQNLSPTHKVLFGLRFGGSLLAIVSIIIIVVFQKYPKLDHLAQINCGHVDVALGLYKTLQAELRDTSFNVWSSSNRYGPVAPGLSDSAVDMLEQYTREVVSNAPQSILLAFTQWCTVAFNTDFGQLNYLTQNKTVTCQPYKTFNLFNYRQMLAENDLNSLLAYANVTTVDVAYMKQVDTRQQRFNSMKILFYTQGLSQGALLIACIAMYSSRGASRDLSKMNRSGLQVVAMVAVQAVISISIAAAVVTHDLSKMMADITHSLGEYGITMHIGRLFNVFFWFTFCISIISSLSWILPVWCSNPSKQESELVYSGRSVSDMGPRKNKAYKIKPYKPRRNTKYVTPPSRIFDDDSANAFHDKETSDHEFTENIYSDTETPFSDPSSDVTASNNGSFDSTDHAALSYTPAPKSTATVSELELRRLGRKMTTSGRTRRTGTYEMDTIYAAPKEDTHNLLYGDNPFANHQYPQTFGKSSDGVSRGISLSSRNRSNSAKRSNSGRTRQLLEADSAMSNPRMASHSDTASLLNEDEANYLDHNNFVNRL